jgi:hypothetical protein
MKSLSIFVLLCITDFVFGQSTNNLRVASRDDDSKKKKSSPKDAPKESDVLEALDDWAKGILAISQAKADNQDYVQIASDFIDDAYNYDEGFVLFKPTLSSTVPFRTTFDGALSYFVGGNTEFPEDAGFAIRVWKDIQFEMVGVIYESNRAILQTICRLTAGDDSIVTAYFSMSMVRKSKKYPLKIDLHHSSLPYSPV